MPPLWRARQEERRGTPKDQRALSANPWALPPQGRARRKFHKGRMKDQRAIWPLPRALPHNGRARAAVQKGDRESGWGASQGRQAVAQWRKPRGNEAFSVSPEPRQGRQNRHLLPRVHVQQLQRLRAVVLDVDRVLAGQAHLGGLVEFAVPLARTVELDLDVGEGIVDGAEVVDDLVLRDRPVDHEADDRAAVRGLVRAGGRDGVAEAAADADVAGLLVPQGVAQGVRPLPPEATLQPLDLGVLGVVVDMDHHRGAARADGRARGRYQGAGELGFSESGGRQGERRGDDQRHHTLASLHGLTPWCEGPRQSFGAALPFIYAKRNPGGK